MQIARTGLVVSALSMGLAVALGLGGSPAVAQTKEATPPAASPAATSPAATSPAA